MIVITVIWVMSLNDVFAIDRLYIDDKGFRIYSCGADMRGARIAIKDIGRHRFRVKSSRFAGIMELLPEEAENRWCTGLLGAVRVLCGYCKSPSSAGSVEDKIKQLGLNSAD